jgi:hypothetical protein
MSAFGPKSMSGGQTQGDRLVRLVYLDEAGLSKPSEEPFLVVAGVIIHADNQLTAIERYLERIARKHVRAELLDGFIFHAKEIFNGGGNVFKREHSTFIGPLEWTLERRLEMADELAIIPKKFGLPIAFGFIDRNNFLQDFEFSKPMEGEERRIYEHVLSFTIASAGIEQWMRQNASNEVCLLVAEDNDRARSMIRSAHNFYQDPRKVSTLKGCERPEASFYFPFKKIKEDPLFQPKKRSHPTIIADFCAYVIKRTLMGDDRYMRFFKPMRDNLISYDAEKLKQQQERRAQRIARPT